MNIDRTTSQRATEAYADITLRQPSTTAGAKVTSGQNTDERGATRAGNVGAGAIIKLSPQAQLFAQALAAARATPDVRADRVAAARAQVASGSAAGDDAALASKLLGNSEH